MKDTQFARVVVFVCSLVPAAIMAWDVRQGGAGPNPSEYLIHTTGIVAFVFLLLSLCVTPLRRLTGKNFWSLFRRMLGLFAFFYASTHFLLYFVLNRAGSLRRVFDDLMNQRYIFFGMLALGLMVPLALTSTAASIKWLGSKKWKWLHRLVYISLIGAAIHYLMIGKVKMLQPQIFAGIATVLLLFRVLAYFVDRGQKKAKATAVKAG